MAGPQLKQADFDLAFFFARSEAVDGTLPDGSEVVIDIDQPRFEYADGACVGLYVGVGSGWGTRDRCTIDPLILPEEVLAAECTVLHAFTPEATEVLEHRAWYSRNPEVTVNALLRQRGCHAEILVIGGYLRNVDGFAFYRGMNWRLPGLIGDGNGNALLNAIDGHPLMLSGVAI